MLHSWIFNWGIECNRAKKFRQNETKIQIYKINCSFQTFMILVSPVFQDTDSIHTFKKWTPLTTILSLPAAAGGGGLAVVVMT